MAERKEDEKLLRLRDFAKRNSLLDKQLEMLLAQYASLSSRDEQYQQLLREFGLDDASQKDKHGVRHFKMVSMVYIVVKGKGRVNDNGTVAEIGVGDTVLTGRGNSHSVECVGDETLEIIALVVTY